jgi:ribonuclease-3
LEESRKEELLRLLRDWQVENADITLLDQALTHPSYAFENQGLGIVHNQRLEFLGDAVLGVIAAEYLYHTFPACSEGELTKIRANAVCEANLAETARKMDLGRYLHLGRGEEQSGGWDRPSILADALEAVIGAIYLTAGWPSVRALVLKHLGESMNQAPKGYLGDYKTALQEAVQRVGSVGVSYNIIKESGPDHNKRFIAGVYYHGKLLGKGEGRNKKEAEQRAARAALEKIEPELEH